MPRYRAPRGAVAMVERAYNRTSNFKRGLLAVRRLVSNPCDRPFIVYAELLAQPTGVAIIQFFSFGMLDLIRSYFRPKIGRSGRKIRGGRRGRRGGGGIPEPSDVIAKRIPGYERYKNRRVSQGVKVLWRIDGVLQRFALWFLIADIVNTWTVSSASIIFQADQEDCDTAGAGYWEGENGGSPTIQWQGFGSMPTVYARNVVGNGGSVVIPEGRIASMVATCTMQASRFDTGGTFEVAIRKDTEPVGQWVKSGQVRYPAGGRAECVVERTVVGPCVLTAYQQGISNIADEGGIRSVFVVLT